VRLELTWAGHAGLHVEHDGFTTVIDPGVLSDPDAATGADALLISHEHLDHYDITKIAAAVAAKRDCPSGPTRPWPRCWGGRVSSQEPRVL
jgi:L-ascorbate metabolism protein UlaG (beta-lactamase superfamily)